MEYEGRLTDGTRILFRHIRPDDKERLHSGFEQLSPESRYRRFFRQIDHLSEAQLAYLTELDFEDHFAWVAVLADTPGQPGVGVARWIRIADEPGVVEGAVTVIDSMHGKGIGTTLLWIAARSAIEKGVKAFRVWVQGDNRAMVGILQGLGEPPKDWESGVAQLDIPLPGDPDHLARTPATMMLRAVASEELVSEADPSTAVVRGLFENAPEGAPDRT